MEPDPTSPPSGPWDNPDRDIQIASAIVLVGVPVLVFHPFMIVAAILSFPLLIPLTLAFAAIPAARHLASSKSKWRIVLVSAAGQTLVAGFFFWLRRGFPGPLVMTMLPTVACLLHGQWRMARRRAAAGREVPVGSCGNGMDSLPGMLAWAVTFNLHAFVVGLCAMHMTNWIPSHKMGWAEPLRSRIYSVMPPVANVRDTNGNSYTLSRWTSRAQKFDARGRLIWVTSVPMSVDDGYSRLVVEEDGAVRLEGLHGIEDKISPDGRFISLF